jgi:hypothetical protein
VEGGAMRYFKLLFFWTILTSCQDDLVIKIESKGLRGHLSLDFKKPAHSEVLWKKGDFFLTKESESNQIFLDQNINKQKLVMVSFRSDSNLSRSLAKIPETLLYTESKELGFGQALVQISSPGQLFLLASMAHQQPGFACGNIEWFLQTTVQTSEPVIPPIFSSQVRLANVASLMNNVDSERIRAHVNTLENLGTRFHDLPQGLQAPNQIKTMFEAINSYKPEATHFQLIDHSSSQMTEQNSLIVAIDGQKHQEEIVIIGAHLDTISRPDPSLAPGADDNASGLATMLEIFRLLNQSQLLFQRRIEFHAYGAEEIGLVGSSLIAKQYKAEGKRVVAMMQFDMNSYSSRPDSNEIYLISTDTDPRLTQGLKDLMDQYLNGLYEERELLGGTSDHKSWTNFGFPAAFPFENPTDFNPNIHTANDTSQNANRFDISSRFAKLGIAYLAHYAGLSQGEEEYRKQLEGFSQMNTDLKLAIMPTSDPRFWNIAVAAPSEVTRVETCKGQDLGSIDCLSERIDLTFVTQKANRQFFLNNENSGFNLGDQDIRLFFGYDASGSVIALRSVRLVKK